MKLYVNKMYFPSIFYFFKGEDEGRTDYLLMVNVAHDMKQEKFPLNEWMNSCSGWNLE